MGSKGFTLMELLVVTGILAIMAVIVWPRFSSTILTGMKVYTTSHHLAGEMRFTQRLGLSSNKNYIIKLCPSSPYKSYKIFKQGQEPSPIKERELPADVVCNSTSDSFTFTPLGTASINGEISIDDGNVRRKIRVRQATGRVEITEQEKL